MNADDLARAVRDWAESPEGREAFRRALDDAEKVIEQMNESRRIDWRTLHEPMTI